MQWVPVYEFVIIREPAPGAGHATLRVHLPEEGAVEELRTFLGERSIDGTALLTATAEACDRAGWLPWLIVIGDPTWRIDTMAAATASPARDVLAFSRASLLADMGAEPRELRTQGIVIAIRSRSAATRFAHDHVAFATLWPLLENREAPGLLCLAATNTRNHRP